MNTALITAAVCEAKKKGCYLRSKFYRLEGHMKPIQAHMAVARKILICAYPMLRGQQDYKDLGEGYYP